MQGFVTAKFGGQEIKFQLAHNARAVAYLETAIGSPFAVYKRLAAGNWTVRDVSAVLSFAHPDFAPVLISNVPGIPFPAHKAVADALEKNPAGIFAGLAAKILEAFLFGLPEARATFDEGNPFGEEAAAA
jgi:hypothetical protein